MNRLRHSFLANFLIHKKTFKLNVTTISKYLKYRTVNFNDSFKMKFPSVISLKNYVPHSHKPAFTRFNVFLRDDFTCQYCHKKFQTRELTFDHLIPRSKGGITNWENVVTSCSLCNWTKGSKPLKAIGFKLLRVPQEPSQYSLRLKSKNFPSNYLHESWRDYLYWDSVLEKN